MDTTINQILIPVDFSAQSLVALDQSYNLAHFYKAELTLLYVLEEEQGLFSLFAKPKDEEAIKKEIEKKLSKLATETSKKKKIKVNVLVARGKVYDKILEVADMVNAKMIIMGTTGSTGLKHKFIGSNALRVVKEALCPVITIKGKHHREGCKSIVLPLDLSSETREKVSTAVELAKLYGSTIHVVSVLFTLDEFIVNHITRQMVQVKQYIEKAGVKFTAEIIRANHSHETFADTIIDYSKEMDGDLIMIMTQQENNFVPLFIGSTAQGIINKSDIPVMSLVPTIKRSTERFVPY